MKDVRHYGRLKDVNTTNMTDAIRLGCLTMQRVFNRDDNDSIFMVSRARPDPELSMSAIYDGHLPGRHLNALLNAEAATGVSLDEEAIQKHRRAAFYAYSGPVRLPMGRPRVGGDLVNLAGHDLREGFHALYALVKYRKDEEAGRIAEESIAAVFEFWNPDDGWNLQRMEGGLGINIMDKSENFSRTLPRAIGSLVKYYQATGYDPALELANVFKDKLLADHYLPDGAYSIERLGTHGHSIACDLSSLAQLADLTNDKALMDRVRAFYDKGMWDLRDEIGWVVEKTGQSRIDRPDYGEGNSTGDLVETALILGRSGHPEYFEDAERMLRCHLLPSQLRDVSFIESQPNPDNVDGRREVAERITGGWGFPAPYGHEPLELDGMDAVLFHMDIVGGVVGSLCDAYRAATRYDEAGGHHVDLLFDHETDAITVDSNYTHDALTVTLKKRGPLRIRIPSWVPRDAITVEGVGQPKRYDGSYLVVADHPAKVPITLQYDLAASEILLRHRTRKIRVTLRGDSVVAMDNYGADLTYFPALDG